MKPPSASNDAPTDTESELRYLAATAAELEHVRRQQELTVQILRTSGVGWGEIGARLGITRQAARQRFLLRALTR